MIRTNGVLVLTAVALLSAFGLWPEEAVAGEFDTNARRCQDFAEFTDVRIGACTWLLQSGQLREKYIPNALNNRGIAWYDKGEYDRAIEDYNAALRIKPDSHQPLNNRGNAWRGKGEYDRAIEDYNAALRIKPDYQSPLINRGNARRDKGEYDRAIDDYNAALRIKPDSHQALNNRGLTWYDKGEYDRAIEDYNAALRIKPDYQASLNGLAWLLATASDWRVRDGSRAVSVAEQAVSLADSANHRDSLAAAFAEVGRFADAVSVQERSLAMARAEGRSADDIAGAEGRLRLYRQGRPYREER